MSPPTRPITARLLLLLVLPAAVPPSLQSQGWPGGSASEPAVCSPWDGSGSASEWVGRAERATGLSDVGSSVLKWRGHETDVQYYQSDRPYPPFLHAVSAREWSFDPRTGVERATGDGPALLTTDRATFLTRDTLVRAMPQAHPLYAPSRDLNPFAVLRRFREGAPTVEARCRFRGYPRVVLSLDGDRLFLDAKSGMPVKLARVESHPTWGQVEVEYVYTTWWRGDGVSVPIASVRYVDGVEQLRRDVRLPQGPNDRVIRRLAPDSVPPMRVPEADHRAAPDPFQREVPVDTVRVGPSTFLLVTPMYTHAVTMQRDTVFLLDATMGEWRSRADSAWIARLFPGKHPIVVVVTDLAWPHVGGVRFWAARGAIITSHALSRPFLEQLLARRWTLRPDALELARRNGRVAPVIQALDRATPRAGGLLRLAPIDGGASEGALYAWIPGAEFLWAGDYIQDVSAPTQYAADVIAAVTRDGREMPRQVAAQHLPLTPWEMVRKVNGN